MSRSADHKKMAQDRCDSLSQILDFPHIAVKGTRQGQKYWLKKPDDQGFRGAYCRRKQPARPRAPLSDEQKLKMRHMRLTKLHGKSPGESFGLLTPRMRYHGKPHMKLMERGPTPGLELLAAVAAAAPKKKKTVIAEPMMSDAAIANLIKKAAATNPTPKPLLLTYKPPPAKSPRFSASPTYDPRVFKNKKAGVTQVAKGKKFRTLNGGKYRKVTKTTAKNLNLM